MKKKEKKNKRWYLKTVVFVISIYCIWNIIFTQAQINKRTRELEDIKEKCKSQLDDNNECQDIISLEADEEYIKRIAREKLSFVSPDDRVFIDVSAK